MFSELWFVTLTLTELINEIIFKLSVYRHSLKHEHDLGKSTQAGLCSPRNTALALLKADVVPSGSIFFLCRKEPRGQGWSCGE